MKRFVAVGILVSAVIALAAPRTSLRKIVERQTRALLAVAPDVYLFEVELSFYPGNDEKTLSSVEGRFARLGNNVDYITMDTVMENGVEKTYRGTKPYRHRTGGTVPIFPLPRLTESPEFHQPLVKWNLDLDTIQEAAAKSGIDFGPVSSLEVTTVQRLRRGTLVYSHCPELGRDHSEGPVAVLVQKRNPLETAQFLVLDATSGKEVGRGDFVVPKPPPPAPGNVSSGGRS